MKTKDALDSPTSPSKDHFYEIWDLPGAFMYFMLNQVSEKSSVKSIDLRLMNRTSQTLLSSNALYVFVMDVSKEVDPDSSNPAPEPKSDQKPSNSFASHSNVGTDMLNSFHVWLGALHAQLSDMNSFDVRRPMQPKVILVASHRNSLHKQPLARDAALNELFDKVRQSVAGRSYESLLWPDYYALDLKNMSFDEPQRLNDLRCVIDRVSNEQRLLGSYIPISWLGLQRCLERLAVRGVHFVARSQLLQLLTAQFDSEQLLLSSTASLHTALAFLQSTGKLMGFGPEMGSGFLSDTSGPLWAQSGECSCYNCPHCSQCSRQGYGGGSFGAPVRKSTARSNGISGAYGCWCDMNAANSANGFGSDQCLGASDWLLVLQPHWLLGCCYRLCAFVLRLRSEHRDALVSGVLREQLLDRCWADRIEQKHVLVGCLERLDLLCELRPYIGQDEPPDVTNSEMPLCLLLSFRKT
jgi:hypothetical protein